MKLKECLLVANDCYKANVKMTGLKPTGIVVHSTGCNNTKLKTYIQPKDYQPYYKEVIEDIGENKWGGHWNNGYEILGRYVCVHAFIGENVKGEIETYQTLPFDTCCWGVGSGAKGSYNYNPNARIQFEICEDDCKNETYFNKVFKEAIEFCAYICKKYDLTADLICSHAEAYHKGYGSNHADCDHWLSCFGKNMDWFRREVEKELNKQSTENVFYRVQVGAYSVKANAEKMLKKLKDAGFNGFITTVRKE